jgi:peptide/nickel transport system permease protein
VTAPIDVTPQAEVADPEAVAHVPGEQIEGRSLGQIAWMRLKRDRVALVSAAVIAFFVLIAVFAPLITKITGYGPADFAERDLIDPATNLPVGGFGGISSEHIFGIEPEKGRDIFARIVYGARVSLLIAVAATMLSVAMGVVFGVMAGYFGGWVDSAISRTMDVLLAFPLLLFAIALVGIEVDEQLAALPLIDTNSARIVLLILIIGFFSWPYMGRIVRGQTLSLREREFVDAARALGASDRHILFKQLLPNLAAPILVYATLIIPTNILFEAALSYLGVGIKPPDASWGDMIQASVPYALADPYFLAFPGAALVLTVLAFNLLGDGLRDALDPRGNR